MKIGTCCASLKLPKTGISIFFLLLIAGVFAANAENVRRVAAVSDLSARGIEESSALIISDRIRSELVKTGVFTMVEREQMEAVLKEQGFQQTGACSNEECMVQIGQLLGVDCMISGSVGKIGRTYTMGLRLIDVKSGKITATANADCKCEIDELLSTSTRQIVRDLLSEVDRKATSAFAPIDTAGKKPAVKPVSRGPQPQSKTPTHSKRLGLKIGLSAGGVVALGTGIFLNIKVKEYADNATAAKQSYETSQNNADYQKYAAEYASNRNSSDRSALSRNISYILAGLCASGLVLTFVF